jgi:hypothetical protein
VNISYHWVSDDKQTEGVWDGVRTLIRPPLAPGANRRFKAAILAPTLPGKYALNMTLVQEGVQWFDAAPIHVVSEVVVQVTDR